MWALFRALFTTSLYVKARLFSFVFCILPDTFSPEPCSTQAASVSSQSLTTDSARLTETAAFEGTWESRSLGPVPRMSIFETLRAGKAPLGVFCWGVRERENWKSSVCLWSGITVSVDKVSSERPLKPSSWVRLIGAAQMSPPWCTLPVQIPLPAAVYSQPGILHLAFSSQIWLCCKSLRGRGTVHGSMGYRLLSLSSRVFWSQNCWAPSHITPGCVDVKTIPASGSTVLKTLFS